MNHDTFNYFRKIFQSTSSPLRLQTDSKNSGVTGFWLRLLFHGLKSTALNDWPNFCWIESTSFQNKKHRLNECMQSYSSILKTENVISRGIPRIRSPCFLGPKNPQNICPTNNPSLVAFICMLSFKSNIQLGCMLSLICFRHFPCLWV